MQTECPRCQHIFVAQPVVTHVLHLQDYEREDGQPLCHTKGTGLRFTESPAATSCSRCRAHREYLDRLDAWLEADLRGEPTP